MKITYFFKLAVKQNVGKPKDILQSIRAIPLHLGANDQNAEVMHRLCPKGQQSWCRYNRAIANGIAPNSHPNFLSATSVELVQDIFKRFRYDSECFVEQIADARTSNHNEALHNILFSMVRKTEVCSSDVMRLGAALAVARYNAGMKSILSILDILEVKSHPSLQSLCNQMDKVRVDQSYHFESQQKRRFADRMMRHKSSSRKERKHGRTYTPGKFSASNVDDPLDQPTTSASLPLPTSSAALPLPTSSAALPLPTTSSAEEEYCLVCGKTEEDDDIIEDLNIIVDSSFRVLGLL